MASSSRNKSNVQDSHAFQRSLPSRCPSSSAFASSSSTFASRSSTIFTRSPKPADMYGRRYSFASSSCSVRFSIEQPTSPGRSLIFMRKQANTAVSFSKKNACACSPTTHPGSFRCSMHKASAANGVKHGHQQRTESHRLILRRSAMKNSLVRFGGVLEGGDLIMRRALSALIRPSSHQQRRRAVFKPMPSLLSVMSKADDS
ncbi:uncharacterized protein LOC122295465 [Carya illinoinensis]|uniref:Serine-rich protein-like protein n=1 Tax=Carya illinoinensis TaxID=32201 RepID=A0A8T1REF6_CARIL|nr:uncharacterized protein LOC122295465 [Carya illinoinensis]KAG6665408.1 hypothetical protein CIPAW_02G159200 [Carya illinoinensis]